MTGDPVLERTYRAHVNTLSGCRLPCRPCGSSPFIGARLLRLLGSSGSLGVIYFVGYVAAAKKRLPGFFTQSTAALALTLGAFGRILYLMATTSASRRLLKRRLVRSGQRHTFCGRTDSETRSASARVSEVSARHFSISIHARLESVMRIKVAARNPLQFCGFTPRCLGIDQVEWELVSRRRCGEGDVVNVAGDDPNTVRFSGLRSCKRQIHCRGHC